MLDYLDGNLPAEDIKSLKVFAALHPELELNFEEELVTLEKDEISFGGKQNLKAEFTDELVIGYMENVLEGKEKEKAEELAGRNTLFIRELELYKQTIAKPDTTLVYENKEGLKRRGVIILFPQTGYVKVAAALVLLVGLWFIVSRVVKDDIKTNNGLATKTKKTNNMVKASNSNTPGSQQAEVVTIEDKLIAKKTPKQNVVKSVVLKQVVNTSTTGAEISNQKEEPQLADRILIKEQPQSMIDSSVTQLANTSSTEKLSPKYIIEEGVDDEQLASKPKGKLWNFASGIFKGLNRRGIENVNGSENNNEIFIGALTISKPH